jgi:hypothetical protein
MKIFRFRTINHSYGYVKVNFLERIILSARIAGGDTGLTSLADLEKNVKRRADGPRQYGAEFLITAKKKKSKCQQYVDYLKENPPKKKHLFRRKTWKVLGVILEWRIRPIPISFK